MEFFTEEVALKLLENYFSNGCVKAKTISYTTYELKVAGEPISEAIANVLSHKMELDVMTLQDEVTKRTYIVCIYESTFSNHSDKLEKLLRAQLKRPIGVRYAIEAGIVDPEPLAELLGKDKQEKLVGMECTTVPFRKVNLFAREVVGPVSNFYSNYVDDKRQVSKTKCYISNNRMLARRMLLEGVTGNAFDYFYVHAMEIITSIYAEMTARLIENDEHDSISVKADTRTKFIRHYFNHIRVDISKVDNGAVLSISVPTIMYDGELIDGILVSKA